MELSIRFFQLLKRFYPINLEAWKLYGQLDAWNVMAIAQEDGPIASVVAKSSRDSEKMDHSNCDRDCPEYLA